MVHAWMCNVRGGDNNVETRGCLSAAAAAGHYSSSVFVGADSDAKGVGTVQKRLEDEFGLLVRGDNRRCFRSKRI